MTKEMSAQLDFRRQQKLSDWTIYLFHIKVFKGMFTKIQIISSTENLLQYAHI